MLLPTGLEQQKSLKPFTSWLVGGSAEYYWAPTNVNELKMALQWADEGGVPVTVLGGGSNVLVSDQGVSGLVLHTHKMTGVEILPDPQRLRLKCLAGTLKSEALKIFLKERLAPAVFLAGLPGDMAGGVVMNAGVGHSVSPREFVEIVDRFAVLKKNNNIWNEVVYEREQIQWHYRKSLGWQKGVITWVEVSWPREPDEEVLKQVRQGNQRRKDTQPLQQPSCGSVFKNPPQDHAGRLIEAAGLKGFRSGNAQVSTKHANFIVNLGDATANDIQQVILHVQETVKAKFQIELTNEVVYLGQWSHGQS